MSDDNSIPRQVAPEGPVPEDRVTEPESSDDTLMIEQQPTTAQPVSAAETTLSTPAPAPPVPAEPTEPAAPRGLVTVRTGPRPGAILLGLLCLLVSAYTISRQTTDWRLDLSLAGPISIGAIGTLLLLMGLVGLVGRRRT
jgi:hypothetical protein